MSKIIRVFSTRKKFRVAQSAARRGLRFLCTNDVAVHAVAKTNKYIESLCEDVIQAMRKCCEVHAGENSVCCSGFAKEHKATDTKTVV